MGTKVIRYGRNSVLTYLRTTSRKTNSLMVDRGSWSWSSLAPCHEDRPAPMVGRWSISRHHPPSLEIWQVPLASTGRGCPSNSPKRGKVLAYYAKWRQINDHHVSVPHHPRMSGDCENLLCSEIAVPVDPRMWWSLTDTSNNPLAGKKLKTTQ